MCGIAACLHLNETINSGTSDQEAVFIEALCSIHHRGPDDQGYWSNEDCTDWLGHKRLSIIDLKHGQQPLCNNDNSVIAIVNGEFYNYLSIRQTLIARGYTFKTESDSEIILPLYQEYGIEFLNHLKGEFAFVIYDKKNHKILFGRDRFGIKPLFYTIYKGNLFIASEVKCLLAMGVPGILNDSAYVNRKFNLSSQTIYQNIYSVKPGHCLMTERNTKPAELTSVQYWNFNYSRDNTAMSRDISQATNSVHNLLYDAVSYRLISDQPIAFYLSGGLDSSAVVGIAHDITRESLPTFTLSFSENKKFDERDYAQLMATHVNADFHVIDVTQALLADNFEEAVWHNEMPIFNANAIGKFILSREVHHAGFKVVLTGEGADEVFSGYSHFRKDRLINERLEFSHLSNVMNLVKKEVGTAVSWLQDELIKADFIYSLYKNKNSIHFSQQSIVADLLEEVSERDQFQGYEPTHVSMYLWSKSMLPNFVLCALGDRMEMAHHIEGRLPFLDHQLVDFVTQLPIDFKIKDRTQKYILREAVKKYLPESLYHRKKHYFQAPPLLSNTKGKMYCLVQDVLRSSTLESLEFLDCLKVRTLLDQLPSKTMAEINLIEPILMEIVSLCFLNKRITKLELDRLSNKENFMPTMPTIPRPAG